ncbi:hypothetical protein L596_011726 [Steinernema carpocapsae]|uniref:Uncharacterized protein n=1 Tax=Steinernema carpocapsae TaxID=34508 RepID=A0A4U5NUU5_STECR|nr:hypothetical protein L596_011726 [Steinernema carpocapsae]
MALPSSATLFPVCLSLGRRCFVTNRTQNAATATAAAGNETIFKAILPRGLRPRPIPYPPGSLIRVLPALCSRSFQSRQSATHTLHPHPNIRAATAARHFLRGVRVGPRVPQFVLSPLDSYVASRSRLLFPVSHSFDSVVRSSARPPLLTLCFLGTLCNGRR